MRANKGYFYKHLGDGCPSARHDFRTRQAAIQGSTNLLLALEREHPRILAHLRAQQEKL